jgi:PadR family transcriptional regulator, regulator of vanillate utilization
MRPVSLRYAILGSLSTIPSSGYDLARQFDTGLNAFWSAAHSQIYPELRRLEEAGLVAGSPMTVGEKLEKRVYEITDEGLDALKTWAATPPLYRPTRDPERLQFIFSDLGETGPIRAHLETHIRHFTERRDRLTEALEAIRAGKHERVARRMEGKPAPQRALTFMLRDLAYAGNIRRAEQEVEWAEQALAELDAYEAEYLAAPGAAAVSPRPRKRRAATGG